MRKSVVRSLAPLAVVLCVGLGASAPDARAGSKAKDTIVVWVDDAHTRKVTVPRLDGDKIAKRTDKSLALSLGYANVAFSIKWERKKGIEYGEKAKELVAQLKQLCIEFNRGKMSLESYRRRLREIYGAEEKARQARDQLMLLTRRRANAAMAEMDKVLGLPAIEVTRSKQSVEAELVEFMKGVDSVPYRGTPPKPEASVEPAEANAKALWQQALQQNKVAVESSLKEFDEGLAKRPAKRRGKVEMMVIDKYRRRGEKIRVPKLDCEHLVQDVERSMRFRPRFFIWGLGQGKTWTLTKAHQYGETAQLLILKYKQLCVQYNSGHMSQEEYLDRLRELYEAEDRARRAREQMFLLMCQQADEGFADLDRQLKKLGVTSKQEEGTIKDLDAEMRDMRRGAMKKAKGKTKAKTPSLVTQMTVASRQNLAAASVADFRESVRKVKCEPKPNMIWVWKDDAKTDKVYVAKLDTDAIAKNEQKKLTLFLSYCSFGPEMTWAKKVGHHYKRSAQMLIVKYKQLCVDFNAGLISLETYDRRRREIEAATEKASRTREQMFQMHRKLAKAAFHELDHYVDLFNRQPQ